ncbi:hypothetical protein D3C72_1082950 [compost metagenome]
MPNQAWLPLPAPCESPRAILSTAIPATASSTEATVRRDSRSRSSSHDRIATVAGMVLVITPAAMALVSRTPLSISSVNRKVPKNACRNRFSHSPRETRRMRAGRYQGARQTMAMTKRSSANSSTGTCAMIDLPRPTLLPTSAIEATRKRA